MSSASKTVAATAVDRKASPNPAKQLPDIAPAAVLKTETVHVNIDYRLPNSPKHQQQLANSNLNKTSQPAVIEIPITTNNSSNPPAPALRTIELSSGRVREGFGEYRILFEFSSSPLISQLICFSLSHFQQTGMLSSHYYQ